MDGNKTGSKPCFSILVSVVGIGSALKVPAEADVGITVSVAEFASIICVSCETSW